MPRAKSLNDVFWGEEDEDSAPIPVVDETEEEESPLPSEDEVLDQAPKAASKSKQTETVIPIRRGLAAIDQAESAQASGASLFFRWPEGEPQVVRFLNPDDAFAYDQHWINRSSGRRSFACIGRANRCPLCAIGDQPKMRVVFLILNLSTPEPKVQSLEVGPQLKNQIVNSATDRYPLASTFWALSRYRNEGKKVSYTYNIQPIKRRDLEEDYGIDIASVKSATANVEIPSETDLLYVPTMDELNEVANEVMARS